MKSLNFDKALGDVLREDAQAEPLRGFEKRLLARLSAESQTPMRKGIYWAALAAGAIAAGLLLTWTKPIQKPYEDYSSVSLAEGRDQPPVATWSKEREAKPGQQKVIEEASVHKRGTFRTTTLRTTTHKKPLSVTPLAIAPLFVEPIEIASLIPASERAKGESR